MTPELLAGSVIAEPPLALHSTLDVNHDVNETLAERTRDGSVITVLYAGNANLFSQSIAQYAQSVELMSSVAQHCTVIAGVGPDLGKMLD